MRYAEDALARAYGQGVSARRAGVDLYAYPTHIQVSGGPIPHGWEWIDSWKAGWLEEDARLRKAAEHA